MDITLEELIEVNKRLGGSLSSDSSLLFALDYCQKNTSKYKCVAMLTRTIVVDHPFTDANKRTCLYCIERIVGVKTVEIMVHMIIRVARETITDIEKIVEMLKNANR